MKQKDSSGGSTRDGYKEAIDWSDINNLIANKAQLDLRQALASNDVSLIDAANTAVRLSVPSKKDHAAELIWWNFRQFIYQYCGRSLKHLPKEAPRVEDMVLFFNFTFRSNGAEVFATPNGPTG